MGVEISPFHVGEQKIQTRLGVRDAIEPWARKVVREWLPDEHRAFYQALPFVVASARDSQGRPWATLLTGEPGFAHSPSPATLQIDAAPLRGDALENAFRAGEDVGLLGIELNTRRRNRLNGRVGRRSNAGFELEVGQAFGNCPQYIHERRAFSKRLDRAPIRRLHSSLSGRVRAMIESSDTFFIATGFRGEGESAAFGMDVSHRGGAPGFVSVETDRSLVFPDYAGNNHFNTLGNLSLDPRAGLLFIDFERGDILQLTGRAYVDWEIPDRKRFPGAQRMVRFELSQGVELEGALPLGFAEPQLDTRAVRVVAKQRESHDVVSFHMVPVDGKSLPPFQAGQYLPVELKLPGRDTPLARSYSLSGSPNDDHYRISVKRESHGEASRHLHDRVEVGDTLQVREPRGDFTLDPDPGGLVVMLAAGIGVTPLLSMLHARIASGRPDPSWFIHGVRDGDHHPFAEELRELAADQPNVRLHFSYSRPRPQDQQGSNHDRIGRVDGELLTSLQPARDAHFYLCGPAAWMAALVEDLEAMGVGQERIHTESFGPSAVAVAATDAA